MQKSKNISSAIIAQDCILPQSTTSALAPLHCQKPQISSIPGISPREKYRYRVILGDEILGDRLSADEALAKGGGSAIAPLGSSKNTLL